MKLKTNHKSKTAKGKYSIKISDELASIMTCWFFPVSCDELRDITFKNAKTLP